MKAEISINATVADVARSAGVSVGTVSRVINGHSNISSENLSRVQSAIETLGYKRRRLSRPSKRSANDSPFRTGNIGMVFEDGAGPMASGNPLLAAYAHGFERACQEEGYHAILEMFSDGKTLPRCVRERKIDGLIIKAIWHAPEFLKAIPPGMPVVAVSLTEPSCSIHQVAPDNRAAGITVTDYLWRQGHRRIAFFSDQTLHPMFLARYLGYEEFLRRQRAFDPELSLMWDSLEEVPDSQEAFAHRVELLDGCLALPNPPTAIIAANDWMAQDLYDVLKKKGLSIPRDISVVGFDNVENISRIMVPALSSYSIPFVDTAYAATCALLEQIKNPGHLRVPGLHLIAGQLVERASVLNVAASDAKDGLAVI
jgi:LacI family transcriptional regulator